MNITEARGGTIYPGNSALGEVISTGKDVTKFKAFLIVITHCNGDPYPYGFPLRFLAYNQLESIVWFLLDPLVCHFLYFHIHPSVCIHS